MHNKPKLILSLLTGVLLLTSQALHAQKQPNIQTQSLLAPDGLFADGELNEWTFGPLQARNAANRISYTVCNDDNNIYFIIRAIEAPAVNKITTGAVTLTISRTTDKKLRESADQKISITYPYLAITDNGFGNIMSIYRSMSADTVANKTDIAGLRSTANKKAQKVFNNLAIKGIKDIPDSTLPVVNQYGVVAQADFGNKMALTYRIAVPVKHLGVTASAGTKLSYQIKLNGYPMVQKFAPGTLPPPVVVPDNDRTDFDYEYLHNATSFWAEYVLAGK